MMEWVDDIAVRRAVRYTLAGALINRTIAQDRVFFERVTRFALSEMPCINIVSYPPANVDDFERALSFGVVGVMTARGDVPVRDDCGICVDPIVFECDQFDNEIATALHGLSITEQCATRCTVTDVSASVLQFEGDGARPSVLIRRLVTATYYLLGSV
ncbi:MAG: hypothetical protein ACOYB0_08215 [Polynucleobacter sp.]